MIYLGLTLDVQVVRSRLQEQGRHAEKRYSGVVDCKKKVLQQEGVNGINRGCATNLVRTTSARSEERRGGVERRARWSQVN